MPPPPPWFRRLWEVAKKLPLVVQLQYFKETRVKLTQDQWVLGTAEGYRVSFMLQPWQQHSCRCCITAQKRGDMGGTKKHDGEKALPWRYGFLSTVFLVPIKDGSQRPVINPTGMCTQSTSEWRASMFHIHAQSRRLDDNYGSERHGFQLNS